MGVIVCENHIENRQEWNLETEISKPSVWMRRLNVRCQHRNFRLNWQIAFQLIEPAPVPTWYCRTYWSNLSVLHTHTHTHTYTHTHTHTHPDTHTETYTQPLCLSLSLSLSLCVCVCVCIYFSVYKFHLHFVWLVKTINDGAVMMPDFWRNQLLVTGNSSAHPAYPVDDQMSFPFQFIFLHISAVLTLALKEKKTARTLLQQSRIQSRHPNEISIRCDFFRVINHGAMAT